MAPHAWPQLSGHTICMCAGLDTLHTQRVFYIHAGGKLWEPIAWLPRCYKVIWHNRSWNVQAHHECIRCWERDQSVYKCIHVHIMCNRSWMEVATFDYKVHVVLEEIENSCHFPRHADRHFYDYAWLWLTLFWHWLVYQGGPVVRAQTQVQHDRQETRKSVYNSEDTCKTMSLHARRINVPFMERQEKETGLRLKIWAESQLGVWWLGLQLFFNDQNHTQLISSSNQ